MRDQRQHTTVAGDFAVCTLQGQFAETKTRHTGLVVTRSAKTWNEPAVEFEEKHEKERSKAETAQKSTSVRL